MRLKQLNAYRAIAILLVFAVAQISLQVGLAQGPQFIARLSSTRGNQPILVNGLSAAPGASIVTGATIETLADQTAEINLGSFGVLELAPNTQLRIDYDQNGNTKVTLIRGCAVLRSKKNAEAEIVTEQGPAAKNDKKKNSVLDVCFINGQTTVNQSAAANAISGVQTTASGGGGLSGGAIAGILAAVGGGALIAVVVSQDESSIRPNPSPSSPQ
ncbi:MAG: hypothetical protein ND895_21805 [Pyrinomonadaceae bacterium]|nr:hypothetical protein [Pyrinomonadaceae bacterium]